MGIARNDNKDDGVPESGDAAEPAVTDRSAAETTAEAPIAAAAATETPGQHESADGGRPAKPPKKQRPFWIELPILLAIAFVMTFLIQTFFFKVYYIPSGSMEKTLHGVADGGDRVLVNKIVFDFADPTPGEVVVFSGPPTWAVEASIPGPTTWYGRFFSSVGSVVGIAPPNEKDYVKRVIATGGQTVECCDAEGRVMVNGRPLTEPYIYQDLDFIAGSSDCTTAVKSQRCFGPIEVPAGSLWMMGDHRGYSKDSTWGCRGSLPGASCQGPIPEANVIGKAVLIVMPISRFQTIDSPDIQSSGNQAMPMAGGLLGAVGLRAGYGFRRGRTHRRRSRWRRSP